MGILSKLMGTAENTAARTGRAAGRGAGRPAATGRRGMKTATPRGGGMSRGGGMGRAGGMGRGMRRGSATPPAASGGLGKLLGSLTGRR